MGLVLTTALAAGTATGVAATGRLLLTPSWAEPPAVAARGPSFPARVESQPSPTPDLTPPVPACPRCAPPPEACDALVASDAVFAGSVIATRPADPANEWHTPVDFRVDKWYGWSDQSTERPGLLTIQVPYDVWGCGLTFSTGQRWVVYAVREEGPSSPLTIAICDRTQRFNEAEAARLESCRARPSDALDFPSSIAVNDEGEVYVGFRTDTTTGIVRRLSPGGQLLAGATRWGVPPGVPYVSEAPGREIFAVVPADTDRVYAIADDGSVRTSWGVAGLMPTLSVGLIGRSLRPAIHVVAGQGQDVRNLVRFDGEGNELGRWPVSQSAYLVAVTGDPAGSDGLVYVADADVMIGGAGNLVLYRADGTLVRDWEFIADGVIVAMDGGGSTDLYTAQVPELSPVTYFWRVAADGGRERLFDTDTQPRAMAVGPDGDFFILPSHPSAAVGSVQRLCPDGTAVDSWSIERLNGVETPTPGPVPSCPGTTPPATETASPTLPTATPTASGTAGTGTAPGRLFLPWTGAGSDP